MTEMWAGQVSQEIVEDGLGTFFRKFSGGNLGMNQAGTIVIQT